MISMKRDIKKQKKNIETEGVGLGEGEKYPYGLRIPLQTAELKKLGINLAEVDINSSPTIKAKAKIIEIVDRQSVEGGPDDESRQRLELQITDMEIDMPKSKFSKYSGSKGVVGGIAE